jgi:hypothetical protein
MTDYAESITCQSLWIPGKTGPFGIVRRAAYLSEGLFQHIGRVQPLVGMQQELERLLATYREVLSAREQRVLLPFDRMFPPFFFGFLRRNKGMDIFWLKM